MQNKYFVSRLFLFFCCKFLPCIIRPAGQGIFQEVSYELSTLADLLNQQECFRLTIMPGCAGELFMIQAENAWWSFSGKARSPRSEGRCGPAPTRVVQACPAGSAQWQRQGPAEDGRCAASGCDAQRWSCLNKDAATCSQRCIAVQADLRVGCRGLSICASCRPLWDDLDGAGTEVPLPGKECGIDSGFVSDHRRIKYSLRTGCTDLSNSKSVSFTGRSNISSSILRENDVLGAHPNHTVAVYINS
jgi:hypothetical protein